MTSLEYDLDSSGSLMTKIQALIAPPESDENTKGSKKKEGLDLHPYYKRPGKGHNRDCCDACAEGGNLICCDKCPASFHLSCHDPPLEDEDIPLGQWLCHKCRMAAGLPPLKEVLKKSKDKAPSENSETAPKEEAANDSSSKCRSRTSSTASLESNKSRGRGRAALAAAAAAAAAAHAQATAPVTYSSVATGPDHQTALDTLIAAASCMNPTQFELPREMVLPINFPGTDRAPTRGKKASASKRSRTHELDNGLVPLPAKTCFECRKSCKRAPLLACDYCPLLFHLDCLDPPLTSLPCGRWMCPNHVEQAIDEKLLTSLSVTQRVALWDKYTGPIDQDAVKTEFLKKARRRNPPFKFKVKLAPRNRARVPNSVKEMYKNRPPLIPTLRDVLRENEVSANWCNDSCDSSELMGKDVRLDGPTETEQEEWLSGIVALQTSIACHIGSKKRKKIEDSDESENFVSGVKSETDNEEEKCGEGNVKKKAREELLDIEGQSSKSTSLSNGLLEKDEKCILNEDLKISKLDCLDSFNGAIASSKSKEIQNGDLDALSDVDGEFSLASGDISKKSQSLVDQAVNEKEKKNIKDLSSNKSFLEGFRSTLEDSLDPSIPGTLVENLDERLIRLFALQRLQQLTSVSRSLSNSSFKKVESPPVQKQSLFWPSPESGLKPRALLTPLNSSQPPMPIFYRVMEIGTGGDMDICLSYYGHCNFVTGKHAVIICDEVNRHYELMNYSEHGTTVDNVLYSCDFSEKAPVKEAPLSPSPASQHHGRRSGGGGSGTICSSGANIGESSETEAEVPPLIQKIRAIVDKRRGVVREEDIVLEPCKMPAAIGKVEMKCGCRASSSSLIGGSGAGWEGTALLNHGSIIKFGCIQFTFSVLNYVTPPQKESSAHGGTNDINSKGPIPHRISKRERDSTSSSTLTVSPSPPPDKDSQVSVKHYNDKTNKQEEDDYDDDEDKDEMMDTSDREENYEDDENLEDERDIEASENVEISESLVARKNNESGPSTNNQEGSLSLDNLA